MGRPIDPPGFSNVGSTLGWIPSQYWLIGGGCPSLEFYFSWKTASGRLEKSARHAGWDVRVSSRLKHREHYFVDGANPQMIFSRRPC